MRRLAVPLAMAMLALAVNAGADDKSELAALLDEFLAGASIGDPAAHERFWADDLVYTSSAGTRTNKTAIVSSAHENADTVPETPPIVYSAADVDIRLYDDVAVVAFRLVATPTPGSQAPAGQYLNTGTFQKREGRWQAVAWQATVMP